DRSALFWLNVVFGGALSAAVAAVSFAAAAFFRESVLRALLPVMGITFLINGLHTQLRAQLARDHRFTDLNRIEVAAFTTGTAAGIFAAWFGAGVWSLATLMVT